MLLAYLFAVRMHRSVALTCPGRFLQIARYSKVCYTSCNRSEAELGEANLIHRASGGYYCRSVSGFCVNNRILISCKYYAICFSALLTVIFQASPEQICFHQVLILAETYQ